VSGTDFVGKNLTADSFGLPDWSGIHLFTECMHFADGRVECIKPQYSVDFQLGRNLGHLDIILMREWSNSGFDKALELFCQSSRFISGGYIASAVLSLTIPIEYFFAPFFACISAGLASILLLASTVTATVAFTKLNNASNALFATHQITSSLGTIPAAPGFVGFVLTLASTILYIVAYRQRGTRTDGMGRGLKDNGISAYQGGGGGGGGANHKYVQLDEQHHGPAQTVGVTRGFDDNAPGSPDSGRRAQRLDEDWAAPDEYSSSGIAAGAAKTSSGPAAGASIPLMALGGGNKQTKDLNTAYEPFSDPR
jgi:hypothetical protein